MLLTRAIASLSEGHCPLCNGRLEHRDDVDADDRPLVEMTAGERERALALVAGFSFCPSCVVGWAVENLRAADEGEDEELPVYGEGPWVIPTRKLTTGEVRRLYS